MLENDKILLDARLLSMIKRNVFRAQLANGHQFVAYSGKGASALGTRLRKGDNVKVRMSPYDMSKGLIVENPGKEDC